MATVTFEYKDLEKAGVDVKELERQLPRLGVDVEDVGAKEITVDIAPNRPDMLDFNGFVRAYSAFVGRGRARENRYRVDRKPAVEIQTTLAVASVRPLIAGVVAKGVDFTDDTLRYFINFTEKLCETHGRRRRKFAIGLHNFDAIHSPLVYDAARGKEFVPLGSNRKMSFEKIIAEHAKGMEYGRILEGSDDEEKRYPYIADAKGSIMGMIPIINSELTRVTSKTRNLFVEVTGVSKNGVDQAARILACSFIDMGASVYPCVVKYSAREEVTPDMEYREIKVRTSDIERSLGVAVGQDKAVELTNRMGYVSAKYGRMLSQRWRHTGLTC